MEHEISFSFELPVTITFNESDLDWLCEMFESWRDTYKEKKLYTENQTWERVVWDELCEGDYPCSAESIPKEIVNQLVEETKKIL